MPVKVFNHTYGRDEEKVFGENTNRSFNSIEVPSVDEFSELSTRLDWLQREQTDLRQWHEELAAALQSQAERMLDRQHADGVVAELKAAISDTTVFTQALYAALDEHDQRILNSYVQTRQEIAELQQKSHVSAQAAQSHLDAIQGQSTVIATDMKALQAELNLQARQEINDLQQNAHTATLAAKAHLEEIQSRATAVAQSLKERQAEMKVMLTLAQQTQTEIQTNAADAAAIKQWQAWSAQMSQGGFWARLLWLFRGNPPQVQSSQNT